MKRHISQAKLEANRKNSILGGQALKDKLHLEYYSNPTYCKQCGTMLQFEKKKNTFCSQSCSASSNNIGRTRIIKHKCQQCDTLIHPNKKFCSTQCSGEARRKYSSEELVQVRKTRAREISAAYRARLREQTPPDADRKAITEFYANCPKGYEVDHIIPISKGGLHILPNLQYLTITENRKKGSKILGAPPQT